MRFISDLEISILKKMSLVKKGWYPNEVGEGLDIKLPNAVIANLRRKKSFWKGTYFILNIWSSEKGLPIYSIKIIDDDPYFNGYGEFVKIWKSIFEEEKYRERVRAEKQTANVHNAISKVQGGL